MLFLSFNGPARILHSRKGNGYAPIITENVVVDIRNAQCHVMIIDGVRAEGYAPNTRYM